jgi:flavorubredoxin
MQELVKDYGDWSAKVGKSGANVAVLYTDSYGFCDRLSQTLARGVTKADVATEMVDLVRLCCVASC